MTARSDLGPFGRGSLWSGMNVVSYFPGFEKMPRQLPPLTTGVVRPSCPAAGDEVLDHPLEALGPLLLAHAAGDDDDRAGLAVRHDLGHDVVALVGGQGQDEQVHGLGQVGAPPARTGSLRSPPLPA